MWLPMNEFTLKLPRNKLAFPERLLGNLRGGWTTLSRVRLSDCDRVLSHRGPSLHPLSLAYGFFSQTQHTLTSSNEFGVLGS